MKITIFDKTSNCTTLGEITSAHITIFEQDEVKINFVNEDEQIKMIKILIKSKVLFSCSGQDVNILRNPEGPRNIRLRFDALNL